MLSKDELVAKYELGTYFEGLCDALEMSKAELRKAIKILEESDFEEYNEY